MAETALATMKLHGMLNPIALVHRDDAGGIAIEAPSHPAATRLLQVLDELCRSAQADLGTANQASVSAGTVTIPRGLAEQEAFGKALENRTASARLQTAVTPQLGDDALGAAFAAQPAVRRR